MAYFVKLYVATFIGFLAIDFVWLGFVAPHVLPQTHRLPLGRPTQLVGRILLLRALRGRFWSFSW